MMHVVLQLIGNDGLLRNKTRILVTHAVQFLPKLDRVIVLEEGRIVAVGDYRDLMNNRSERMSSKIFSHDDLRFFVMFAGFHAPL